MKKCRLGRTGMEISVMGLGTMYFGSKVDEQTSFRLMDLYLDFGGNLFDSANKYASWVPGCRGGESEYIIRKWLRRSGRRADLILSSKVGFSYGEVPRSLKKEIIISECEKSLARLGVETIDLYFAHAYDEHTPIEETMEAFYSLKKAGKIRHAGASNYPGWRIEAANVVSAAQGWEGFCCLQQRHTFLESTLRADFGNQLVLTPETEDLCRERELTLMAYSPLLGGIYGKDDAGIPPQYQSLSTTRKLASLSRLAIAKNVSLNQLVLSWMLHSSPPVVPLVTGSSEQQLRENLAASSLDLSRENMESLAIS